VSDLRFDHLPSTRQRRQPARIGVLHWTGGIRDAAGFYDTMRSRNLSVHHFIDAQGRDWQMASYNLVCKHAGKVNDYSVGIEAQNPAYDKTDEQKRVVELERKRGVQRAIVTEPIRGKRPVRYLDFTPAQTAAIVARVELLCDQLNIPRRVPTEADGSLLRREMTDAELASFRGWIGHWQCHPVKNDPGSKLLETLRLRWAAQEAA